LDQRPANFSSVPAQYQKIVAEQQFTLKTSSDQIKQLEAEIELLGEVSLIRGSLAKEKLATRVQALDAERNFSQAQAELLRNPAAFLLICLQHLVAIASSTVRSI
jgi:hypothetical protein